MSKLVDSQQLAFIKGRQIMDAVLIANEDSRLVTKKPRILCKLDIEKYMTISIGTFLRMTPLTFYDAEEDHLNILRLILVIFEGMSGLHVNWRKSFMYPVYEVPRMEILKSILEGEVGVLLTTYLGMPLGAKSKSIEIWDGVTEKRHLNDGKIPRVTDFFRSIDRFSGLETGHDRLQWLGNSTGIFKVGAAYGKLNHQICSYSNGPGDIYGMPRSPTRCLALCDYWLKKQS
ncbi:hypothetical protein MTR67_045280 [Solanum verrucosum]|uniref:Reverse transcriptase domain-containing protein n=1 Tax=Solanum verrucosum TaxID=315347 RepID=A0AAF0USD6_SOLVR|nr:hypothetical protein MTR67_045280 [Solanum verrucosum]